MLEDAVFVQLGVSGCLGNQKRQRSIVEFAYPHLALRCEPPALDLDQMPD